MTIETYVEEYALFCFLVMNKTHSTHDSVCEQQHCFYLLTNTWVFYKQCLRTLVDVCLCSKLSQ